MTGHGSKRDLGHEIVRNVFGGPFYQQGRGYYVSLEFFSIVRGVVELEGTDGASILLDPTGPVKFRRGGLIVARRVMHGDSMPEIEKQYFRGGDTQRALQTLLEGLELRPPGRLKCPSRWQQRHFYPYPSELAHYDAVDRKRKGKIDADKRERQYSVERYTYRGGGGFVYGVLSRDSNTLRRSRTAQGLRDLVGPSHTALGRVATALAELDGELVKKLGWYGVDPTLPWWDKADDESQQCDRFFNEPSTRWQELIREGVDRILQRKLPKFRKVDALMNWLPLACAFHQHERAVRCLGLDQAPPSVVFDAGVAPGPVRDRAKRDLRNAIMAISESLEKFARQQQYHSLLVGSSSWRTDPRSFYTGTLNACGAINALKGDRFFSLTPKLLETVVLATLEGETSFESFCTEVLLGTLGWVVDADSAKLGGVRGIESGFLDANARQLSRKLGALGLMREYSDATRMIGVVE